MKRIIVCCDGTSNRPERRWHGDLRDRFSPPSEDITNVVKIVRAMLPRDFAGEVQSVEYVRGIGSGNLSDQVIGGITGDGISDNIEQAYQFIANNFEWGDKIFLFGFSRGAFTARSLSGFLYVFGILERHKLNNFPEAYLEYLTNPQKVSKLAKKYGSHTWENGDVSVPVHFLGVWDTVGMLKNVRLPGGAVEHHNTDLAPNVTHAYHALAVHELRSMFPPTLWATCSARQTVEQVWFPGSHCNVGGGLKDSGLSNWPLRWMIDRASRAGLAFSQQSVDGFVPRENASIELSFKGKWQGFPKCARDIDKHKGVNQYQHQTLNLGRYDKSHTSRITDKYAKLFETAEAGARCLDPMQVLDPVTQDLVEREKAKAAELQKVAAREAAEKIRAEIDKGLKESYVAKPFKLEKKNNDPFQ